MNLRWLEDFLAVCETRSFTEAARNRFLTQSALSKHMQALEIWLGAGTLLDRSTNPLGITSAGLSFKETASQIVTLLNAARRAASNNKVASKNIYVSSTHSLSATFVPVLSKLLYEELSNQTVCLHVAANNFREALSRYERAECDYFLCYDSPVHSIALDHDEHSKLTLGTDYLVPVSIPAKQSTNPYYAITRTCERPLPYLGYTEESHLGKVLENHPAFAHIVDRLTAHARSAYSETLRAGVLAGLGVAWLPYSLIRGNLEDGDLTLASNDVAHYIPLTIDVYRQRRTSRDEVLQCWEIWRTHVRSLNYLTPELPGMAERPQLSSAVRRAPN
ncbi:MAG TPA: LysR family transcriptional regulator [Steroidobacteraceae bacterium]|nr:LysR family transcriptional regulator [Steroidobacteraceae bacterium]